MKRATAIQLCSITIAITSLALWLATGREGYTRWPDSKLAATDAPQSDLELELLSDIGIESHEDRAAQPDIESRFALGLMPGGFAPKYLPSVATALFLALGLSATVTILSARHRTRRRV